MRKVTTIREVEDVDEDNKLYMILTNMITDLKEKEILNVTGKKFIRSRQIENV